VDGILVGVGVYERKPDGDFEGAIDIDGAITGKSDSDAVLLGKS
jgi:hypothetical protein